MSFSPVVLPASTLQSMKGRTLFLSLQQSLKKMYLQQNYRCSNFSCMLKMYSSKDWKSSKVVVAIASKWLEGGEIFFFSLPLSFFLHFQHFLWCICIVFTIRKHKLKNWFFMNFWIKDEQRKCSLLMRCEARNVSALKGGEKTTSG